LGKNVPKLQASQQEKTILRLTLVPVNFQTPDLSAVLSKMQVNLPLTAKNEHMMSDSILVISNANLFAAHRVLYFWQ
jgi:hypothetical protein